MDKERPFGAARAAWQPGSNRRTTRKQSLTEPGRAYCERCRLILAEADAADTLADPVEEGCEAVIRLGPVADTAPVARAAQDGRQQKGRTMQGA